MRLVLSEARKQRSFRETWVGYLLTILLLFVLIYSTGIDTRIDARKNERLQLAPNIEGEGFDASNCRFEWKAISVNDADSATVIGTERELDYLMLLPEGAYTLYFTITDRPTGVFWQTNYELWVTQVTSEGWMVLCSDRKSVV